MKLLSTLLKFVLNNLHTSRYPRGTDRSQSSFLGNLPLPDLQELVSDRWSWHSSWYRHVPQTPAEATPQTPAVNLPAVPQSRVGMKAEHLIAWQVTYYVSNVLMCNYWRRYEKTSRPVFLRPRNKWLPLHLLHPSLSDDMIGNTCHEFTCHWFPYFC